MKNRINGGKIPDFKNNLGNWVKSIQKDNVKYETISGVRWKSLNSRCSCGGSQQRYDPSYQGVVNKFTDFNSFVDWSRQQFGYDIPDYQLDKDLLRKGNKVYCPDVCLFIPARINSLIIKREASRGLFPLGVYLHKSGKFEAKCQNGSRKQVYLGTYNTPEEAFQVYKVYKEALIKEVAEEYKDAIDIRAYNALMSYTIEIDD